MSNEVVVVDSVLFVEVVLQPVLKQYVSWHQLLVLYLKKKGGMTS
jgi:hypothetical protein